MSSSPSSTGSGESVFVSDRSAAASTVVSALAELFEETGSLTPDATPAWLVIVPGDDGADLDHDARLLASARSCRARR